MGLIARRNHIEDELPAKLVTEYDIPSCEGGTKPTLLNYSVSLIVTLCRRRYWMYFHSMALSFVPIQTILNKGHSYRPDK